MITSNGIVVTPEMIADVLEQELYDELWLWTRVESEELAEKIIKELEAI